MKKINKSAQLGIIATIILVILVALLIFSIIFPKIPQLIGIFSTGAGIDQICPKTGIKISEYADTLDSYIKMNSADFSSDDIAVLKQTCEDLEFCSEKVYSKYKEYCNIVAPVKKDTEKNNAKT